VVAGCQLRLSRLQASNKHTPLLLFMGCRPGAIGGFERAAISSAPREGEQGWLLASTGDFLDYSF
jgi:hypothetical protein